MTLTTGPAAGRGRPAPAAIATLEGGGSIGIGFAVPIDRARQVAAALIGRG